MPSFISLSALFGALAIVANPTSAGPVRPATDFHFKDSGPNQSHCPQAHGTKYTVGDKTFGILCGWDTRARGHKWGPYWHLDFDQCIQKCAEKPGCSIATYTGTCYLKKGARGKGFMRGNSPEDMAAIKLHKKKKHHKGKDDDDDNDGKKKHHKGHKGDDDGKKKHHKGHKSDADGKTKHPKGHKGDDDGKPKHYKGGHDGKPKHHKGHKGGDSDGKKPRNGGSKVHHSESKDHTGSKHHATIKHHKVHKSHTTKHHAMPHKTVTGKPTTITRTVEHPTW